MPQILLAQTGNDAPPGLRDVVAAASDLPVAAPATAAHTLEQVAAQPAEIAAVVFGPGVRNPLEWVQRVHAHDAGLSVVLLVPADGVDGLRNALSLTPQIGEDVSCVASDAADLGQRVAEAAERRRRRQAHDRVTSAMNRRISQVSAPPPIAADFGRLLDYAPIGVVTVDPQGAIGGCNRQAESLLGRAERELLGGPLPALFPLDDREGLHAFLARAVEGADVASPVYDRSPVCNERQHLELSAVAVEIGPKQAGALVLLQDVTARELAREERDRTEEALRQQRRWYEATILGIGDAVIATNAGGHVTLMNAVAEQLTGWSQAEAAGRDSAQVFHIVDEATGEIATSPIARVLHEGATQGLANHTVLIARDGQRVPIDDSGAPIRDGDGNISGVVLVFRDISERRRAEEALRTSERRFRAIFEQAAVGIALVAPDATVSDVNERFCELVGYSRQELRSMDDPVGALTHPDDLAVDRAESAALIAGEGPGSFQLEKRYIHKQGHAVWVRLTASALRDEAGDVRQLIGITEDIGDRKRAEAALRASEEHLRLIFESLTDYAIFTLDLDGRVSSWNRGAERLLGYRESEVLGESADLIFTEQDRRENVPRRELETAREHGESSDDRWHARKDGSQFWASGVATPLMGSREHARGFVKILRDQTESKHAQEQLEARARQQAAVASLGQRALAGVGVEQLFEETVRVVAQTLGIELCKVLRLLPGGERLRLEAGVGWPEGAVGHAHVDNDASSQAGYTLLADGPVVVQDLPNEIRFSGPPLLTELGVTSGMSAIIAGDQSQPWGILGAHTRARRAFSQDDVNFLQAVANILAEAIGRSRTEQRLRNMNQTLEQRVAERTAETEQRAAQLRALTSELTQTEQRERRRLAQVLHDHLQQMLVAAKFQLGTAGKGMEDPDAVSALDRVGDLLDKSIQESRSLTVELSPPVLYEAGLVAGLEWLGRWMQEQHGLTLELDAAEGVDPAEEDIRVLLFQTARELLFNVVKHASVDRAEVALRRDERNRIELQVQDRGGGFVPEEVEPSEDEREGFGLFSIRERFARLGGELRIESAPGEGTRAIAAVAETTAAGDEREPDSAAEWASEPYDEAARPVSERSRPAREEEGIRVVVADDHAILREGLVGMLSGQPDIDVVGEAADGQAAVDLVRQTCPTVAVLDITMPRMNGLEAARIISREFPEIRVIGLSVHESGDMAEAMHKAGASVYLNKAGPSSHLLAAIRGQQA